MKESERCPICRTYVEDETRLGGVDAYRLRCPLCGTYDVSGSARVTLGAEHSELLPYLSAYTRQSWEFEHRIVQLPPTWPELAGIHKHTSVHQRAEKLLRVVENRTREPGDLATLHSHLDFPLIDAVKAETFNYFLKHLEALGYVEVQHGFGARLTVKGWDRLDPGRGGAGIPGRVFVAMSFDPSLDAIYEQGIKAAIENDCLMTPVRVDKIFHEEKICDRIIAEIRRSQMIVADFTMHKAGVYFEAGFALALGRVVIWTCRDDQIAAAHFDTRQYPHIVWKDAADLRKKLRERVQALMQRSQSQATAMD